MIEDVRRLSIYTLNQASTIPQSNKFQFQVPVQRTFNRNIFSSGLIILKYLKVGSPKAGKENDP